METTVFYLTEKDKLTLKQIIYDKQHERENTPSRPAGERMWDDTHQAPELYIAQPQDEGDIPAMDAGPPPIPGVAVCDIYNLQMVSGDNVLARMASEVLVYNFSTSTLSGFIIAARDKAGTWWAVTGGGGGGDCCEGFTGELCVPHLFNCDDEEGLHITYRLWTFENGLLKTVNGLTHQYDEYPCQGTGSGSGSSEP